MRQQLGGHDHENWVIERGSHDTQIVKADANIRSAAIVTIRVPAAKAKPIVTARRQPIDDRVTEGPRTAGEGKKWVKLGHQGFRAVGLEPNRRVAHWVSEATRRAQRDDISTQGIRETTKAPDPLDQVNSPPTNVLAESTRSVDPLGLSPDGDKRRPLHASRRQC